MEGDEVWVVTTWSAHGEGTSVLGVYVNREAAFEALKDEPNMTVWVDGEGMVRGQPRKERDPFLMLRSRYYLAEKWGVGEPMTVRGRKPAPTPGS